MCSLWSLQLLRVWIKFSMCYIKIFKLVVAENRNTIHFISEYLLAFCCKKVRRKSHRLSKHACISSLHVPHLFTILVAFSSLVNLTWELMNSPLQGPQPQEQQSILSPIQGVKQWSWMSYHVPSRVWKTLSKAAFISKFDMHILMLSVRFYLWNLITPWTSTIIRQLIDFW